MEELLNKLIESGWKPRGLLNEIEYIHAFDDVNQGWRVEISYGDHGYYKALRQIVSKESGLWQFVCKNGMVKLGGKEKKWLTPERLRVFDGEYQYRLIESALKDESELEQFLLDNITVNVESN